jgi:fatty acid desaturase
MADLSSSLRIAFEADQALPMPLNGGHQSSGARLPRRWLQRDLSRSALKVGVWAFACVGLGTVILTAENWLLVLVSQALLGLSFAHGLELTHEALHHNMFRHRSVNRVVGRITAAPLLVSYSHYRYQHLHHHRAVGTEHDKELIDYRESLRASPGRFLMRAFNVARIPLFLGNLVAMLRGNFPQVLSTAEARREVLSEYLVLASLLGAALAAILSGYGTAVVMVWIVPWLVFGELFHFLIELPEHLGCDKAKRDGFVNTRSYRTSRLWNYITNGNNYHVEHHLYPRVAVHHLGDLNERLDAERGYTLPSYAAALRTALLRAARDGAGK